MLRSRTHLKVESLDGRILPSVSVSNGTLNIVSTNAADRVIVQISASNSNRISVSENNKITEVNRAGIGTIAFSGLGGNDTFINYVPLRVALNGGTGNDDLTSFGTGGTIDGGDHDDQLRGFGSRSYTILGGKGNDGLTGGDAADSLDGGADNDVIGGGKGQDTLWGGSGHDALYGHEDADKLYGGSGDDWLDGGVLGAPDNAIDRLYGESGRDTFVGEWYWVNGKRLNRDLNDFTAGADATVR